jgi:hypothetical protein
VKILVDAKELDKAFNAVANARNYIAKPSYARQQLQIAYDILGPMWVNEINEVENKITTPPGVIINDNFARYDSDGILISGDSWKEDNPKSADRITKLEQMVVKINADIEFLYARVSPGTRFSVGISQEEREQFENIS